MKDIKIELRLINYESGSDHRRLTWLRQKINEAFTDIRENEPVIDQLKKIFITTKPKEGERYLFLIHLTIWKDLDLYFKEMRNKWKKNSCFIVFSGGKIDEDRQQKLLRGAEESGIGGQVKIYREYFPPEGDRFIGNFKKACEVFISDATKEDPDWAQFKLININEESDGEIFQKIAALDILLHGYLLIRNPGSLFKEDREGFGKGIENVSYGDKDLAKERTMCKSIVDQKLFRIYGQEDKLQKCEKDSSISSYDGSYWFDECLSDIKESKWDDMVREWPGPGLSGKSALQRVWRILRGTCLGEIDGIKLEADLSQDQMASLFAEAHQEYQSLFELGKSTGGSRGIELEKFRNVLNHDRIKNNFLYVIGTSQYSGIKERSRNIIAAWDYRRGITSSEDEALKDRLNNVRIACDQWKEILTEIRGLFGEKLEQYGFALTAKGEMLKREIIDSRDSPIERITKFINDFEGIGGLSTNEKEVWLERFWNAADRLHEAIAKMGIKNDDNGPFGGYIKERER